MTISEGSRKATPQINLPEIAKCSATRKLRPLLFLLTVALGLPAIHSFAADQIFRVAAYNLENYLDAPVGTRQAKSDAAKAKIRETIKAMAPDVLALEEVGGRSALEELQRSLAKQGLEFPHSEYVTGFDTNVHVAVLSKFPFADRRSHTNESYLLGGRRLQVSRGFAEVDIQVNASYQFTLFATHLKSKRTVAEGDETEMRFQEARLLREKIDARFAADPNLNLIVLGDLNDTKDSASTKVLIGRGKSKLTDARPAERNGGNPATLNPAWDPRNVTWTHFYGKTDSYERIDYILISPGMTREWLTNETYIPTISDWGIASDHRPVLAAFVAKEQ